MSDQPGERPRQAPGGVLVVGQDVREPDQAVGASRGDLGEIARHGPPLSRPITGQVTGFALEWAGQRHGVLWISGDTVLYGGPRQVADRLNVGTAVLHLGGVRFPVTGPVRYTMTAAQAVRLCRLLRPRAAIPVHYEGWQHFRQGAERELEHAPGEIRDLFRWLPIGEAVALTV